MNRFIPREKLGKKARKKLDSERRAGWTFSPVSRRVESKKVYSRKGKSHDRYNDYGHGVYFLYVRADDSMQRPFDMPPVIVSYFYHEEVGKSTKKINAHPSKK